MSASADIVYDFSQPGIDLSDWSVVKPNYQEDEYFGDSIYTPGDGFDISELDSLAHTTDEPGMGYISQTDPSGFETSFLKLSLSSGLAQYAGGEISIMMSDNLLSKGDGENLIIEWMLFSATVNGSAYTLGYHLPFRDGTGIYDVNFSLDASNFQMINSISFMDLGSPGAFELVVETGEKGVFDGLDFGDFLDNCDGIYIRSIWQSNGFVGGEEYLDGTKLFSISITEYQIPEPSGIALCMSGLFLFSLKRRRK